MKIKYFLVGLLLVPSFAISATAQTRMHQSNALPQAYGSEEGRACMNDQGPSQCGEPMWVYGSPGAVQRYKKAF